MPGVREDLIWQDNDNGGSRHMAVTADAQLFVPDTPSASLLSNGGVTLTVPINPLWQFSRLSGDPAGITGCLNGSFDGEGIGTHSDDGTSLATRERRAQISTGPGAVAPDGNSWTFTTASGSYTNSRVT